MEKRIFCLLLTLILLLGSLPLTAAAKDMTAEEKAAQVAFECRAALGGSPDEYEVALWLHDWLITHVNYDYTYSHFEAADALLRGSAVCLGYAEAYRMLLDEMGIESILVEGDVIKNGQIDPDSHAWNLVRIRGQWTHVDCTWDDPNEGGMEYRYYFAIGDEEIQQDHIPAKKDLPKAVTLYRNAERAILPPPNPIASPRVGVDYVLTDTAGNHHTRASGTKVILIYGDLQDRMTRSFLRELESFSGMLLKSGIEIYVIMKNAQDAAAYLSQTALTCTYPADNSVSFWRHLGGSSYYYPYVFLQDENGMVHWEGTGGILNADELVSTALQPLSPTAPNPSVPVYFYRTEAELSAVLKEALARQEQPIRLCRTDSVPISENEFYAIGEQITGIGRSAGARWTTGEYWENTASYTMSYPHTHTWRETANVPASCTKDGSISYACTCGEKKTDVIPAFGHIAAGGTVHEPTCTEPGRKEESRCLRCDTVLEAETELPAYGHHYLNGKCTRCGAEDPEREKPVKNPFRDVKESAWYYQAVLFAYGSELFAGTAPDTFSPNQPMTRGMLVTVLWRLDGKPITSGKMPFRDVKAKMYYAEPILWAYSHEIVNGVGEGNFAPDGNVTREQIAKIIFGYAELKGCDTEAKAEITGYPDYARVSSWAREYLAWANAKGLIGGTDVGGVSYLDPKGNATRAQVAAILQRFTQNCMAD